MNEIAPLPLTGKEFSLTRTFNASRSQVWAAFTMPEHLRHWWGPRGCAIEIAQFDLRAGGIFLYCMKFPGNHAVWGRFIYREISTPERLVWVSSFSDQHGGLARNPFADAWPLETLTTVTLQEKEGITTLSLTATPINCTDAESQAFLGGIDSMTKGFGGTFAQLEEYLSGVQKEDTSDREMTATRVFDAPRDLVFRMWTEAEHLVRWWGPNGFATTIQEMNVRPGGEWRLIMHAPDGRDFANHNRFLEVVPSERLVFDHLSGPPKHRMTVNFAEKDGKTEVAVRMVFESAELLEHVIKEFNAKEGLSQTLDRLGREVAHR